MVVQNTHKRLQKWQTHGVALCPVFCWPSPRCNSRTPGWLPRCCPWNPRCDQPWSFNTVLGRIGCRLWTRLIGHRPWISCWSSRSRTSRNCSEWPTAYQYRQGCWTGWSVRGLPSPILRFARCRHKLFLRLQLKWGEAPRNCQRLTCSSPGWNIWRTETLKGITASLRKLLMPSWRRSSKSLSPTRLAPWSSIHAQHCQQVDWQKWLSSSALAPMMRLRLPRWVGAKVSCPFDGPAQAAEKGEQFSEWRQNHSKFSFAWWINPPTNGVSMGNIWKWYIYIFKWRAFHCHVGLLWNYLSPVAFFPLHASVLSDCWTRSAFFYILRCAVLALVCS